MSDNIVERLRWLGSIDCPYGCDEVGNPAADEVEQLRALADQLADGLRDEARNHTLRWNAAQALETYEEARRESHAAYLEARREAHDHDAKAGGPS